MPLRYGRDEQGCCMPHPNPDFAQPKTIGDALESAASDKHLEVKDARAIQAAEARATGIAPGVQGGPAAAALSATMTGQDATLGDVLADAKSHLPMDKTVTQRDANRVRAAERRNDPEGRVQEDGVAAKMQEAADFNKSMAAAPRP